MDNNVLITMQGNQLVDDEEGSYELITEGTYVKRGEKYYATYKGSEITGYDKTTTTMKMKEDHMTMIRFGESGISQMVFEPHKQFTGIYRTPLGSMSVDVYTNEMRVEVDDNGGEVELDYFISMNSCEPVRNKLFVAIRKVD